MEHEVLQADLLGEVTERDRVGRRDQRFQRLYGLFVIPVGTVRRGQHEAAVSLLLGVAVRAGRLDGLCEGLHGIVPLFEIEQPQRVVDSYE